MLQDFGGFHAADGDGDTGNAHCVTEAFLSGVDPVLHGFAAAAETLHAERRDVAAHQFGEHELLKAAGVGGVQDVERHLHGVERVISFQHLQMDVRIFVAGEAHEAHFALLLCLIESFNGAAGREDSVRVVIVDDFVDLPDVQMIRAQSYERLFELAHGDFFIAAVGAELGHQDDFVAAAHERFAHALFAEALMVFPGVVEEVDAAIDGFVDDARAGGVVFGGADVIAADADDGGLQAGLAERAFRDVGGLLGEGQASAGQCRTFHEAAAGGAGFGCGFHGTGTVYFAGCGSVVYGLPVFFAAEIISWTSLLFGSSGN